MFTNLLKKEAELQTVLSQTDTFYILENNYQLRKTWFFLICEMSGCNKMIVILIFAAWISPWPTYGLPQEFQIKPIATCGVIEDRSKVEKPCIFPFSFRNITYTNCTTEKDPDNKAWSQFQQLPFCLQLFTIVRPFYNH